MKQKILLIAAAMLFALPWSTTKAQSPWSQQTACPGWNNPANFTVGGTVVNKWSGQGINITSTSKPCPNPLSGATGVSSMENTVYQASQLANVNTGSCASSLPSSANQFVIMDNITGFDPNTGNHLPYVPTQFNTNDTTAGAINTNLTRSIRIGDGCYNGGASGGNSGAALYYTMRVTPNNALLYLYYAIVAEAPDHNQSGNPTFIIRVMKKNNAGTWTQISDTLAYYISSTISSCSQSGDTCPNMSNVTLAGAGGTGWHWQGTPCGYSSMLYKDWEKACVNLSNYLYDTVQIQVLVYDCIYNAHYGYGYIAGECRPMRINSQIDDSIGQLVLSAPQGQLNYVWYASEYGYFDNPYDTDGNLDYATWRPLTSETTLNPNGYRYYVQPSDFQVTRRRENNTSVTIDSIGNRQTFRCAMTSALDPSKPFTNYLYINAADPILHLSVTANDSTFGTVTGAGTYLQSHVATISAIPNPGHHFVMWNDGVTVNPRTLILTQDTSFTAIFAIDTNSVTLLTNNSLYGTVTGAGLYPYGTTVTIEATANNGYHFAEWSNGSRENPLVIVLESDTTVTAIFTDDVVPQICMITVQDGRNMVMWDKELEVQAYNIYREGITAGEYELVASVPYDSLSAWVDTASRPRTRSYRYRMTATDIFGIESEPSVIHKTMHLYINQGLGNECNLVWSEYEGADYSTYIIYRGTDVNNIHQIDVMAAGGNTTYTDENPPAGEVYYQVGILLNTPCNPTKSSTIVLSNIAIKETVGISETPDMDNNICIYSENGCIYVSGNGQTVNDFHVYDVVGREVYHANHAGETPALPGGVYLVKVGNLPARRVVVIR